MFRTRFQGDFAVTSRAYLRSCTYAANPIIVERKLVRYAFYLGETTSNPFQVGRQVVISTDNHGYDGDGHGLFGLLRHMAEELTDSSWPMNRVTMLIEIHTIPGFDIDWHKTRPWPFTPFHTVFIQPHIFCEDRFELLSILLVDCGLPTVTFHLTDMLQYQLTAPRTIRSPPCLPSPLAYPQHGTEYLLYLATRREVDFELNDDMIDEILSIRAQTGSVPPSPTMVADELSADEMSYDEEEDEAEETEHEFEESEQEG